MAKITIDIGQDMSLLVRELKGIARDIKEIAKENKLSKKLRKGKAETSHVGGG